MKQQNNFFSPALMGLQPSKISVYSVDGEIFFEWDHSDPELIAAGINDITPEGWAEVAKRVIQQSQGKTTIVINS